jgi:small membrane protein
MISTAKIFLLSLVVLAIGFVVRRYGQRKIAAIPFLLWLFLWGGVALVILFPESAVVLAHLLGIGRGTDLALYLSVILILFLLFRVYVRLEQVDREITQIVRAVALREAGLELPAGGSAGKTRSDPDDRIAQSGHPADPSVDRNER